MATACVEERAASAATDRLVRSEPSAIRIGGRAAPTMSACARGTTGTASGTGRAATGTGARPPSLLARFLTPAVYNSLKDVRTRNGFGIDDVTRSGRVNTDSSVGMTLCLI